MINCPKCQVPNPDTATACAACGTTLVGQQFVQALDQAMGAVPPAPPPRPPMPPPMTPGGPASPPSPPMLGAQPSAAPAFDPSAFGGQSFAPLAPAMDPGQAQAEINQFMAEQRARKRTKTFIYLAIFAVIAGVIGFMVWRSSHKKQLEQQAVTFYQAFNKIDDDSIGGFWKCTVRAKDMDVHKATEATIVTEGLEKAFRNFPKGQPGWLLDKCIPMIALSLDDLGKLKPPSGGFAEPLEGIKASLKEVRTVIARYAATIDKRKQEAADEQEIRDANGQFHNSVEQKDSPKAVPYFNILKCAIPELMKKVKSVNKPPDTQPVVEYIYETCKKDPKYADTLRKECFAKRNEESKATGDFKVAQNKMAGDARDIEAINDCFRRANQGFAFEETKAVGDAFVKYFTAREELKKPLKKLQEELRGN